MENMKGEENMEKIIYDNGACKLTEIFGDYRLYSVSTVDMDGIKERDLNHVYTFYSSGYARNERTGRTNRISYGEDFNLLAYVTEFYNNECKRLGV